MLRKKVNFLKIPQPAEWHLPVDSP